MPSDLPGRVRDRPVPGSVVIERGNDVMDGIGRIGIVAMAAGLAMSTPAQAREDQRPVKVGIMDLKADSLTYDASNVRIEYKAFTPDGAKEGGERQETGDDHGAVVASAFVRHYRHLDSKAPIEIYSGNPFGIVRRDDGKSVLRLNFGKALEALEWMHSKGVRIVVTAYNSSDRLGAKLFMDRAENLGMVVFAAYSNSRGAGAVFPAADHRAISVVDTSIGMRGLNLVKGGGRDFDGARAGVMFAMDGGVPQGSHGGVAMVGSSYTSAKAAAYGVYALRNDPSLDRNDVVERIKGASRPHIVSRDGESYTLAYLGDAVTDDRFVKNQRIVEMSMTAKAPASREPVERIAVTLRDIGR